jgi:2,3-bisphosphoglycerate-dependent phosphoglycerate mutase
MIVFVVRHADKLRGQGQDGLNDKGVARAELLARMLADSKVSHAYCSEANRTLQTIAPLKRELGASLQVKQVEGHRHATEVVAAIRALPTETVVLVVSHTNTVREIIAGLGGPTVGIADDEFDKLFVLFRSDAVVSVAKLRYGDPTPPPSADG